MTRYQLVPCLSLVLLFISTALHAQSISGYVMNEENQPIPDVNIYLKNTATGTSTDSEGRYFLQLPPGQYDLIFSAIGYEIYEISIILSGKSVSKNIWLNSSVTELNQIVVRASKKDPAYEIIQKVIEHRKETRPESIKSDVYVKAIEILDQEKKEQKEKNKVVTLEGEPLDPFGQEGPVDDEMKNTNMVEINLVLNYQYPNHYKEERTGYKLYGNSAGLFLPRFSETDFNIYDNLIFLEGVIESPVISPISPTSILSYKYKLEGVLRENEVQVYKIKVIPRKKGNSTVEGTLYVNDSLWNINRLELAFEKGSLKFYDSFVISQNYRAMEKDSSWVTYRQEFTYKTRQGKNKTFRGNTVIHYENYQTNYAFPPKFFTNEVAVTTKEAYEQDSTYWNSSRPEPLTTEEQEVVHYKDSVNAVLNSKPYMDSIEARYNKVTFGDILYDGIGFRNYEKQENVRFSSLLNLVDFAVIGGIRLGPYAFYFKRFDTGQALFTSASLNLGLKNLDPQGRLNFFYRYLPFRLGDIDIRAGRAFQIVNQYDAYLNQLKISNYILHNYLNIRHSIELFNGFYFRIAAEYSQRKSIEDYDSEWLLNKVIDGEEPLLFENYEALISDISFSYTPRQLYMREPTYKRVLGSNYPTMTMTYRKGWPGPLSSDVDFDYAELKIDQNLMLGILGNTWYTLRSGRFFNTRVLKFIDLKRFSESNPYLYSDPLNSFQMLDTTLVATNWFFEGHLTHHFNGALINNIPLIRKLRLYTVAGLGGLWIRANQVRYEELHAGMERIFKLNARRRLRVGIYGVLSESNSSPVRTSWKVSFDLIDTWKKDWSY